MIISNNDNNLKNSTLIICSTNSNVNGIQTI